METFFNKRVITTATALVVFIAFALSLSYLSNEELEVKEGDEVSYPSFSPEFVTRQTNNMIYDFDSAWLQIEKFEKEGLPKSALDKVKELLDHSKKENRNDQLIKALIYKGKYESQLSENGIVKAINDLEAEISNSKFPVKNILQSMVGEMYANFLSNNLWKFQNRTETETYKSDDIQTWTVQQLIDKSNQYCWTSLSDELLKSTPIEEFDLILEKGENDNNLRPTLFDFLAHRAIDHFMNERNYVSQPAYKFEIENGAAFSHVSKFLKWDISSRDSSSQKMQVLKLFQQLLAFRSELSKTNDLALLDANLKRLQFVRINAVIENKDELYLEALKGLQKRYKDSAGLADINYLLAEYYRSKGNQYKAPPYGEPDEDENKWLLKEAYDMCLATSERYGGTVAESNCYVLMNSILVKNMHFETELVNIPKQPFLTKLTYRNVPKVYLRVIPFTQNERESFEKLRNNNDWQNKSLAFLNTCRPVKTWSVELPDDGAYQSHSVEIPIDALPLGLYAIVVSETEDFVSDSGNTGYVFTHISNIGYWERKGDGQASEFFVFDRNSGQPIEGAEVEFWVQQYNSVFRKYQEKKKGQERSDENGFVKSNLNDREDRNFYIRIKHGNDILITDQRFYNNIYTNHQNPYQQTHFFLDRAIYRPGQTIYFKGIAVNYDTDRMPTIIQNGRVTVTLRDANYQEAAKLELQTNQYGTFSGQFIAPRGGLLGNMQIVSSIGGSAKYFKVEEYKRPKFEVVFEPIKESFRLNDTVNITGKATAYAGNQIDGAQVKWRVVRETHFPWYWRHWGWLPWRGETMEIKNGTGNTDENGNFQIEFLALPNKQIPADKKPEFHYTIYADVTDITGETRSSQSSMKVGYVALQVDIPIGEKVKIQELDRLEIITKNLNGEFEPAKGKLKIERLASPSQVYAERFWEMPDSRLISESQFKKLFPQFAWKQEHLPQNWKSEQIVFNESFDTDLTKEVILPTSKMLSGWYALTLNTSDKYDIDVEVKKYFQVFDLTKKELGYETQLWDHFEQKPYTPGQTFSFEFRSALKQPVLVELLRGSTSLDRKWMTIKEMDKYSYQINEEDRGGLNIIYSYGSMNRSFNNSHTINVPWDNKELSIKYGTFRDKLKPGQEEEWVVKIKGPKGEQVAAEMVAGMYDASLDAFAPNNWGLNVFPTNWSRINYSSGAYQTSALRSISYFNPSKFSSFKIKYRRYDQLNWFGWNWYWYFSLRSSQGRGFSAEEIRNLPTRNVNALSSMAAGAVSDAEMEEVQISGSRDEATNYYVDGIRVEGRMKPKQDIESINFQNEGNSPAAPPPIKVRTNLNETVFFYPNLMTDEEGNILIKFKMNEALTRWKFLGLAHTEDLKIGLTSKEVVTQKELMVVPNPPRFFRENDEIEFTAKVVNLTDKPLSGNAELQLVNPMNSMPVYKWLDNPQFNQNFKVEANQSARLAWRFKVPDVAEVPVIEHTVIAVAGDYSDGEKSAAPVLTNRMLVTETKPLPVRGKETKGFVLNSLKNNDSPTLRHQSLTLEFTQNPAWYAVQALPYLMEYPHECTEQIFSRFYANSLATSVANAHPKIKSVFEKWRDFEPEALKSNLSKNQELKSALLEETPWVLNAQSEEQQKQNIGLLFDLNRMAYEQEAALKKIQDRQMPGGGWAWFPGGRDSWYITQYLVEGFGHLQQLNAADFKDNPSAWRMVEKAVNYCDARIVEQYEELEKRVKKGKAKWEDDHLNYMAAHYLYTRSFFLDKPSGEANTSNSIFEKNRSIPLTGKAETVHKYYMQQAEKYWLNKGLFSEGMLSLALSRNGNTTAATKIVRSLKERSLNHEEMGMYWKYPSGWWWYQAPIETHSLMIEVFNEITNDQKAVDDLKVWLLKNKQTTHWKTTKATANAVYALLNTGDNWLIEDQPLRINFGNPSAPDADLWNADIARAQSNAETGTGYFKLNFEGDRVTNDMANIQITNPNNVVAWGAMYWQYFEQLDKIKTFEETPLTIKKQLFRVENTDRGEQLQTIDAGEKLKVGEKLKARIELRVDRDMEYVHMKDMRASGFEPINVLSQYKRQGGLGYYESTRDAATNFFFSWLPKGTYVFEYPLRVVHNGDFSNGVTTIQSMYAPEFSSHSEGIRVLVGE